MNRTTWMGLGLAALIVVGPLAGVGKAATEAAPATDQPVKKQTVCPVTQDPINKKQFVDVDGKRIYLCCPMCAAAVKKDGAKYVKMIEDQGITLDKTPAAEAPKPGQTAPAAVKEEPKTEAPAAQPKAETPAAQPKTDAPKDQAK